MNTKTKHYTDVANEPSSLSWGRQCHLAELPVRPKYKRINTDPEEELLARLPPRQTRHEGSSTVGYAIVSGKLPLSRFAPPVVERAVPTTIDPLVLEQPDAAQVIALAVTLSHLVIDFANAEGIRASRIEITTFADPEETQTQVVLGVMLPIKLRQTIAFTMAFGRVMEEWIATLPPESKRIVTTRMIALDVQPE